MRLVQSIFRENYFTRSQNTTNFESSKNKRLDKAKTKQKQK
jgi:hypothetical protein